MLLHVRVVEARDVPKMDVDGLADPYCVLSVNKEQQKTRKIEGSLNPLFRQDFKFKIENFMTDTLEIKMYDFDKMGKDDLIGRLLLFVSKCAPGTVSDQWFDLITEKGSKTMIRLWIHLAAIDDEPFVARPFVVLLSHVRIIEAKGVAKNDYCCSVGLGSSKVHRTTVKKNTDQPDWCEEFTIIVGNYENDSIKIVVFMKKKSIGEFDLPVKSFDIGKVVKPWLDLKDGGKLRIAVHIASVFDAPFAGEAWDDLPPISDYVTFCVRVICAEKLPKSDVVGESDPYCTLSISSNDKDKKKTRVVKDDCSPKWNQEFQLPVRSLMDDMFKLVVYDWDECGSDDKLGEYSVLVRSLKFGVTERRWVDLSGSSGKVYLETYLGSVGSTPFVDNPFWPMYLGVIVVEAIDVPKMDMCGLSDPFCLLKLSSDSKWVKTAVIDNTLHPIWDERVTFITTSLNGLSLELQLKDQDPNDEDLISVGKIDALNAFVGDSGTDIWVDMTPAKGVKRGGRVHLVLRACPVEYELFNNMHFEHAPDQVKESSDSGSGKSHSGSGKSHSGSGKKHSSSGRSKAGKGGKGKAKKNPFAKGVTLYVTLANAYNVPVMDPNGLADPYVEFKLSGSSKKKKKSSVQYETLMPVWDEEFRFNINDMDNDMLEIVLMDYDKIGRDDLIGRCSIFMRDLKCGPASTQEFRVVGPETEAIVRLGYYFAVPGPNEMSLYTPYVLHTRIVRGEKLPSGKLAVKVKGASSTKWRETSKRDGSSPVWQEDVQLEYLSAAGGLQVILVGCSKSKDKDLAEVVIHDISSEMGLVTERHVDIGGGRVFLMFDVEPKGVPSAFPAIEGSGFMCEEMTLNIKIISASGIQAMDRNGKSDPYIIINHFEGKKEIRHKTKIIRKTLNPVWNEEFQIPVKSIQSDSIEFSMRDHDDIGSDDKISRFSVSVLTLPYGMVVDKEYEFLPESGVKSPGRVRMLMHLCAPGNYAFIERPFEPMMLHVYVWEAKDVPNMDFGGKSDPYCLVGQNTDKKPSKTRVINDTLSPQWNESFTYVITSMKDTLDIVMKDDDPGRDGEMGRLSVPLSAFQPGYVYEDWHKMTSSKRGKSGGEIRLKIHIAQRGIAAFDGIPIPKAPEPAGEVCEVQIDLTKAMDLPSIERGGSDAYCRFTWIGRDGSGVRSRVIDNCNNPIWDQRIRMPCLSLGTDVLRVEVMDENKRAKDTIISMLDIPISSLALGVVHRQTFNLIPVQGRSRAGRLDMAIQVTQPGQTPFVDRPFDAYVLNVRIVGTEGLSSKQITDLLCKVKMENDSRAMLSSVKENCSNAVWNEDFQMTVTNYPGDSFEIVVDDAKKKKSIGVGKSPISSLELRKTQELDVSLKPSGKVHVYAQIALRGDAPFADIGLRNPSNGFMTLYVKVLEGKDMPAMDSNGLCDAYIAMSLIDRKNTKKTEVQKKTLTPVWNQEFQFPVLSYGTDTFDMSLYDHDDVGRDDKIGSYVISVCDLPPGIVQDRWITIRGSGSPMIHVVTHLAAANQPKFEDHPFLPHKMWVEVCEAMDIAKTDTVGKSDPYVLLSIASDRCQKKTKVLDNTLTPQWFERFELYITDLDSDVLQITMKDEGNMRDLKMATLELQVSRFEGCYIYDEWHTLTPSGKVDKGGKLRLRIQVSPIHVPQFSYPELPRSPDPASNRMELVVSLREATNVPIMDRTGSDAFCVMEFVGDPTSVMKSRVIDNTTHPRWNQTFRMPVMNLNSGRFVVTMIDEDKITKDDPISSFCVSLRDLSPGVVYDKPINMTPKPGVNRGGTVDMAYHLVNTGGTPFVTEAFVPFEAHILLNTITGLPSTLEKYYCELRLENETTSCVTMTSIGGEVISFSDDFRFLLRDPEQDVIQVTMFKHVVSDCVVVAQEVMRFNVALCQFAVEQVHDHRFSVNGDDRLQARVLVHIVRRGQPTFPGMRLPQPDPVIDNERRCVYVKVLECSNLPAMDANGLTDAYCKITLRGRKKLDKNDRFVGKTRVIEKERNPVFNDTFCIPVKCLDSDCIKLDILDYDKISKDDKMGSVTLDVNSLEFGTIMDKYFVVRGGKIHVMIHFADVGQPAFVPNPFKVHRLHLQVMEAVDISKSGDVMKPDGYCKLRVTNSVNYGKTRIIRQSRTPQWFEQFSMFLNSEMTDSVLVTFAADGLTNGDRSFLNLACGNFQVGYIYDEWYSMFDESGSEFGKIRVMSHIALSDVSPFNGTVIPKPALPAGDRMELHLKFLGATNVPNMDADGGSDSYCWMEFVGHADTRQKTRLIDNSANPKWNQEFRMSVTSLNTNVLKVSLFDWDKISKDDLIGSDLIRLRDLSFGRVETKSLVIRGNCRVNVIMHLARAGDVPFAEAPFVPLELNVHVKSATFNNATRKPYVNVLINDDVTCQTTTDNSCAIWNESMKFLLTDQTSDVLSLWIGDTKGSDKPETGFEIERFSTGLGHLTVGNIAEVDLDGSSGGKLSLIVHLCEMEQIAFNGQPLPPRNGEVVDHMSAYVWICEAEDLEPQDINGLADPYVRLKLCNRTKAKDRRAKVEYTRVLEKSLHPLWNQIIRLPVHSYATDVIQLRLFDRDRGNKDDKIMNLERAISSLTPGVVQDEWIRVARQGRIHVRWHLANANQPAFTNSPFTLLQLNVKVIEARNFTGSAVDKSDPYCCLKLVDDTKHQKTHVRQNTQTPQWFEDFTLPLTQPTADVLELTIRDDDVGVDKVLDKLRIDVRTLEVDKTQTGWYKCEKKGEIRLIIQVAAAGAPRFMDYVEPNESVTGDFPMFHVKVVGARGLPRMDGSQGSSDAYCVLDYNDMVLRTRTVENSLEPVWDQEFHFNIKSFNCDCLKITVVDHDKVGSDDTIGVVNLRLNEHAYGLTNDQWVTITDSKTRRSRGELHIKTHVARGGQTSFDNNAFTPLVLHAKVTRDASMGETTEKHPYFAYRIDCDTCSSKGSSMGLFTNDVFSCIVTEQTVNGFVLKLMDHNIDGADTSLGNVCIPLSSLVVGTVSQTRVEVSKDYFADVALCLQPSGAPDVFAADGVLSGDAPVSSDGFRVFIGIDSTGGSKVQTFEVGLKHRKTTPTLYTFVSNNTPKGQVVWFDVKSLNTDELVMRMLDSNIYYEDTERVTQKIPLRELKIGDVEVRDVISNGQQVQCRIHIACPQQMPFSESTYTPKVLHIHFIEGHKIPKMDMASKNDSYCTVRLAHDAFDQRTRVIDDSMTPQWNQTIYLFLANDNEIATISIYESDVGNDKLVSTKEIRVSELMDGRAISQWLAMTPRTKGKSNGGMLNVAMQVAPIGYASDLRAFVVEPLPADLP